MERTDSPVGSTEPERIQAAHLGLSGERTVPGVAEENYWFRRHEIVYREFLPYCADALVLDAGCGEGYGSAMISSVAARTTALDYDGQAAGHVRATYGLPAVRADLQRLPLRTGSVGVVVNFQVIEHLHNQPGFLAECGRVLRPGGRLLVSTPNRITFSPGRETPLNPYHTRELSASELEDLLREAGFSVRMLGVRHGELLRALDAAYGGSIIDAQIDVVMDFLPGQADWPPALLADVAAIRAEDFEITEHELDTSLDLIAIAERK